MDRKHEREARETVRNDPTITPAEAGEMIAQAIERDDLEAEEAEAEAIRQANDPHTNYGAY